MGEEHKGRFRLLVMLCFFIWVLITLLFGVCANHQAVCFSVCILYWNKSLNFYRVHLAPCCGLCKHQGIITEQTYFRPKLQSQIWQISTLRLLSIILVLFYFPKQYLLYTYLRKSTPFTLSLQYTLARLIWCLRSASVLDYYSVYEW